MQKVLAGYDPNKITIGVLGGHSALDVCHGAKKHGFKTVAVCQIGRDKTYSKYYKTRENPFRVDENIGCIDDVILVDKFSEIVKPEVQEDLRKRNTIFIHNRYFWVYCDFDQIEKDFEVPIYGSREMVKLEERDVEKNQYYMLDQAGIRTPKLYNSPQEIDRLVFVKVNEELRGYERAFFFASSTQDYNKKAEKLIKDKVITEKSLKAAVIEEYIVGAPVNFNYFYSPLTGDLELMGTDTRRQTNLDGLIRIPALEQMEVAKYLEPKIIETGHIACTTKESILEKAFDIGEKFVEMTKKEVAPGIVGPFALQGAVAAETGREEIVIFDVSMRIPGSPGTRFTPTTGYLYGDTLSYGERIALEIKKGIELQRLGELVT